MSDNNEKFISVTEAAKKLKLTPQRVSSFCRAGRLTGAKKVGTFWIIPEISVNNFVRQPPGLKKKEKNSNLIKEALEKINETKEHE